MTIKGAGGGTRFNTAYGKPPGRKYEASCPDYTGCLNAMHAAMNILTHDELNDMLSIVDPTYNGINALTADAYTKAVAFLQVKGYNPFE